MGISMIGLWVTEAIVVLALLFLLRYMFRIIRPTERGLVERFGKYNRFCNAGLQIIIPFVENLIKVNITEKMIDANAQEIITKDKLNARVDAQIYFRVLSSEEGVKNSQYNVFDYERQIVNLARTTLRNIIGTMNLTDANIERGKINKDLMVTLSVETKNWGIEVVRTELKEISPPKDVQETMNEVVKAENTKQAAVDFATATETQADGKRRATIKEAEGDAQSVKIRANAQAEAIKVVNESANKYFVDNAQILKRYEVFESSLKNNSKIVITKDGIDPVIVFGDVDKVVIPKQQHRSER